MKSFIKKTSALILALSMVLTLFAACSRKKSPAATPEDTVAALEEALNTADIDRLLACLSSDMNARFQALLVLMGQEEKDTSPSRILDLLRLLIPMIPSLSDGLVETEDLPRIRLTPESVHQEEDSAEVSVAGELLLGGLSLPFSMTLAMEKEEGLWVITGIA